MHDLRVKQIHFQGSNLYASSVFASTADKPTVGILSLKPSLSTLHDGEKEKQHANNAKCIARLFTPISKRFTPRVPVLKVWTSQTSHFRPFLHEWHYLFTVPTFPTEWLKRIVLGSGVPTLNSCRHFQRHAPRLPAWETEGQSVQAPGCRTVTSRKQIFFSLLAIFSISDLSSDEKKGEVVRPAALSRRKSKDPI